MQRRSFLTAVLAAVAGLLGLPPGRRRQWYLDGKPLSPRACAALDRVWDDLPASGEERPAFRPIGLCHEAADGSRCGPVATPVESTNPDGTHVVRWTCLKCGWVRRGTFNPATKRFRWSEPDPIAR